MIADSKSKLEGLVEMPGEWLFILIWMSGPRLSPSRHQFSASEAEKLKREPGSMYNWKLINVSFLCLQCHAFSSLLVLLYPHHMSCGVAASAASVCWVGECSLPTLWMTQAVSFNDNQARRIILTFYSITEERKFNRKLYIHSFYPGCSISLKVILFVFQMGTG